MPKLDFSQGCHSTAAPVLQEHLSTKISLEVGCWLWIWAPPTAPQPHFLHLQHPPGTSPHAKKKASQPQGGSSSTAVVFTSTGVLQEKGNELPSGVRASQTHLTFVML